jgi:NAD(P)H-dependent FMN reductase
MKVLAISGSLRAGSSATALARALAGFAPPGTTITLYDELESIPPFHPDRDREGDVAPAPVARLRAALTAADAVVVSTPEYAFGVPGALKNALDWTVASGDFAGKPTAAISSSPSDLGGDKAYASLLLTLGAMQARLPTNGGLIVPFVRKKLDARGAVVDAATADALRSLLRELAALAAAAEAPYEIPPSALQMPEPLALMKRKTKQ